MNSNTILIVSASLFYFFIHFAASVHAWKSFSFLVWIKENWYNCLITAGAIIALSYINQDAATDPVTRAQTFASGFAIQAFIDHLVGAATVRKTA